MSRFANAYLAFLLRLTTSRGAGQSLAEYGHANAGTGASTLSLAPKPFSAKAPQPAAKPSAHLETSTSEPSPAEYRQSLEQRAGKDAANLNLTSEPPGALVRVDGQEVGRAPLILKLAPGTYNVEMEGDRKDFARRQITLLSQENRAVALRLQPRYPTHIELRSFPASKEPTGSPGPQ